MYTELTTFVLGAGASVHYGYPVGEELVQRVREKARWFALYCEGLAKGHQVPKAIANLSETPSNQQAKICGKKFADLAHRLEITDPVVIDYFLGQNQDLARVGKFLIAWILLEAEDKHFRENNWASRTMGDKKLNENWLRFVLHQMLLDCQSFDDLMKNQLFFVTFNYDVSLEAVLSRALKAHGFLKRQPIEDFLDRRVVHVYGSLSNTPSTWAHDSFGERVVENLISVDKRSNDFKSLVDYVFDAASGINVIDPLDKGDNEQGIREAQANILNAKTLYLLGYGFDHNNNQRLRLADRGPRVAGGGRKTYFTNYGDRNRINKAAGLLFAYPHAFVTPGGKPVYDDAGQYVEKSTSTTYDALSKDFDA